jgi:dTDP-4-amino-4,6-dideoxygalactose transaminase
MDVPFVDLTANYRRIEAEIDGAMAEVIESTQFIGGDTLREFERAFADYVGVDHAVGVGSGTEAIRLGLETLGVGDGDEVVTVSHTFVSTVDGIVNNGGRPRFVDVDPDTYTMDPSLVEDAITDRTEVIMPVHLYGGAADLDPILDVAADHDVRILEDAAQAHGTRYKGERVGQFGDIACYSFYPSKNLGAFGDAGMVVTDDDETAEQLRALREYGETEKYRHELVGYNSRMDTLQATVLRTKLDHLDEWNDERRTAATQYNDRLADTPLVVPEPASFTDHIYHLYVVRTRDEDERDALQAYLDDRGVDTGIHYPIPVHEQPSYQSLSDEFDDLPVTERVTPRILSLPMYPEITDEQVAYVCDVIEEFYDQY